MFGRVRLTSPPRENLGHRDSGSFDDVSSEPTLVQLSTPLLVALFVPRIKPIDPFLVSAILRPVPVQFHLHLLQLLHKPSVR